MDVRKLRSIGAKLAKRGISVIGVDANKVSLRKWSKYQTTIATPDELSGLFGQGVCGIATVCGKVSGNLETIDFDHKYKKSFEEWSNLVKARDKDLFDVLQINMTPSTGFPDRGFHVRYRCEVAVGGSQELAKTMIEGKPQAFIETRGEGGYALSPPSPRYDLVQGSLLNLPTITKSDREMLLSLARSFDETKPSQLGIRAGDRYNDLDDFEGVLTANGWTKVRSDEVRDYWKRPGSTLSKWSATFNRSIRMFYVHTTNSALDPNKSYSPFALKAFLDHGGDFKKTAESLYDRFPDWRSPEVGSAENLKVIVEPIGEKSAEFDLRELVPKGTWLSDYCDLVAKSSDAPDQFAIGCGMSCLSYTAYNRYMPFSLGRITPNMWLALIAPSTLYRKSSSINTARRVIEGAFGAVIFPDQLSPEAFVKQLADPEAFPHGVFVWNEISSQLHAFDRSYMRGYKSDLTDLYDCPKLWRRRTQSDGLLEIEHPFINILTASTPVWLSECLSEGNLKGGFLPRFVWILATEKTRHYSFPDPANPEDFDDLVFSLREKSASEWCCMSLSDEAKSLYKAYDKDLTDEALSSDEYEDLLGSFYGRLAIYCLKFSILYSVNRDHDDQMVSPDDMKYAIRFTEYLKQSIGVLLEKISYDGDMRDRQRVKQIIGSEPGLNRSRLIRRSRMSAKRLDMALDTLFQAELVTSQKSDETDKRRSTLHYYLVADDSV